MKEISKYQRLRKKLIENSDPELARQMESYMRNKFKFYGLRPQNVGKAIMILLS